uniref:Copine domain-containing protein n=1 Tax=Brugia timori TaxID=42155 RepID=A0A0R3RDG8_9BILA
LPMQNIMQIFSMVEDRAKMSVANFSNNTNHFHRCNTDNFVNIGFIIEFEIFNIFPGNDMPEFTSFYHP